MATFISVLVTEIFVIILQVTDTSGVSVEFIVSTLYCSINTDI